MNAPFSTAKHPGRGPGVTRPAVIGYVQAPTSDALRELILNALDVDGLHELVDVSVPLLDGIATLIAGRNTANSATSATGSPIHPGRRIIVNGDNPSP
jgi:hypothetical protein